MPYFLVSALVGLKLVEYIRTIIPLEIRRHYIHLQRGTLHSMG